MLTQNIITNEKFSRLICLFTWIVIATVIVVFQSGFYNPDSFKYVAIASDMLSQHHYILPMVDGKPYSDKGPMMFWLFILGWKISGVNHWWPQLLMVLTALGSLFLTLKLAEILWPDQTRIKQLLPIILLGLPSWIVISSEIRVDIFLMAFCLSGLLSLLLILQGKKNYWYLYGVSLALGFLCKGPVILLYTFLPALFLPFVLEWNKNIKLISWYGYLILSTCIAILIAFAWAIPAILKGGHTYYYAILFKQIYDRAFQQYSWLYYIVRVPMFVLPWGLYLPFLFGAFKYSKLENGERFCWLIILISFIVFSFYGQKRVRYLDPDFALFAIIIARAISNYMAVTIKPKLTHQWFFSLMLFFSALLILWLPHLSLNFNPAIQTQLFYILKYNIIISIILFALAICYFVYCPKTILQQMILVMLPSATVATAFLVLRVV